MQVKGHNTFRGRRSASGSEGDAHCTPKALEKANQIIVYTLNVHSDAFG